MSQTDADQILQHLQSVAETIDRTAAVIAAVHGKLRNPHLEGARQIQRLDVEAETIRLGHREDASSRGRGESFEAALRVGDARQHRWRAPTRLNTRLIMLRPAFACPSSTAPGTVRDAIATSAPASNAAIMRGRSSIGNDKSASMNASRSPRASPKPRRTENPLPRLTSLTRTRTLSRPAAAVRASSAAACGPPSMTTISFPRKRLRLEIRADVSHRAADAAGFVVGGDDQAEEHYSILTLPSPFTNACCGADGSIRPPRILYMKYLSIVGCAPSKLTRMSRSTGARAASSYEAMRIVR